MIIILGIWIVISLILIYADDRYSIKHFREEWQRVLIGGILGGGILAFILGGYKIVNPALDSPGFQETNPTWHIAIAICLGIGVGITGFISLGHLIKMLIEYKGKL